MIWLLLFLVIGFAKSALIPYQVAQQLGSDIDGEAAGDASGYSASLNSDGTVVAIGAYWNDGTANMAGHVRVYSYSGSTWTQVGSDIDGEAASDYSGNSVSLSSDGTVVAIGATKNDGSGTNAGHVRVYSYSGSTWSKLGQDIDGEAAGDESGVSVSLNSDGTVVAIVAWLNAGGGYHRGHVRVYSYSGSTWTQLGSDLDGEANSDYTNAVSLSSDGTVVAMGAGANDGSGTNAGHVRVYSWDGGTWTQLGSDIDGAAGDTSGNFLSLSSDDGTVVAIGATHHPGTSIGTTRVYQYSGNTWTQMGSNIDGEAPYDYSGCAVSLSSDGKIVAIGAYYNDGGGDNAGHVRVYEIARDPICTCSNGSPATGPACTSDGVKCTSCDAGYFLSGNDSCDTCIADYRVQTNACVTCPPGKTNAEGDDATGTDTSCDTVVCTLDQNVISNVCTNCPPGTIRPAGDDASGADTSCTQAVCDINHRVENHECKPCENGLIRLAGDRADRADTECFDASTCGGLTCDATGSSSCVDHKCVCNAFFGGADCSKDRSPSARLQKLRLARKKAVPTREDLKLRQKEVKDLAREILQEEIAKGLSTKLAVKNSKIEVEIQDIQQEAQIVVAKMAKTPVIAVAPENKDVTDTCDQGPACATLDIAEEGDEMTFLDTAEEAGSWSALANGDNIVSKQTKVSEGVYDMQCWNNTWGTATRLDTTAGGKLYECNGHIILVGSQASICTPTTCQNGGTCTTDGLAFSCDCADGFTGDFCETTATMTHCHQIDCSDFGGHKAGECTDCNVGNCCNYATRSAFDTHCDTLSSTQDYVNAKCCHRTYCI